MTDTEQARMLRTHLAESLERAGVLSDPAWAHAVRAVPRHVFLPAFFRPVVRDGLPMLEPVTADRVGHDAWMKLAYLDETWVTQLDGRTHAYAADGPTSGVPTSSSTLPSLVVRMLHDLDVHGGERVLEIGTGTGYSTALMCYRLGSAHVTSIEYDAEVAKRACAALHAAGCTPTVITGDGLDGDDAGAPYDRIIATCAVRRVPLKWLRQLAPGGFVLATLSGWLLGSALARVTVERDGSASGYFLPSPTSFMLARPHAAPTIDWRVSRDALTNTPALRVRRGGEIFDDPTSRIVAQLAAPYAIRTTVNDGEHTITYLVDPLNDCHASLYRDPYDGFTTLHQIGKVPLWDKITEAVEAWDRAGSPHYSTFAIHITRDGRQTIHIGGTVYQLR